MRCVRSFVSDDGSDRVSVCDVRQPRLSFRRTTANELLMTVLTGRNCVESFSFRFLPFVRMHERTPCHGSHIVIGIMSVASKFCARWFWCESFLLFFCTDSLARNNVDSVYVACGTEYKLCTIFENIMRFFVVVACVDGTEPKLAVFSNKRQKFFNCFVLDQSKATATHTLADIPRNIRGTATEKGKIARVIYILYEEHTAEACEKEFSRTFERWQAALRALARSHCSAASRSGPSFLLLILFCVARCHRVGSHRCRQNHRCLVSSSSCLFFFS